MKFREYDFDNEGDLLQTIIEFQRRKEELNVFEKEWHCVWMLLKVQKRKGMEHFQYQALRDVLKEEGERMKDFVAKYWEVKVQTSREKSLNTQYCSAQGAEGAYDTMFIGTYSLQRRRIQEARNRRDSNTIRQDSRGWDYVRKYERFISQSHKDRS